MHIELTDKTIKTLKPAAKRYIVQDNRLRGFRAVIYPSGEIVFQLRYRVPDGQKDFRLGRWPDLRVAEARKAAERHRGDVANDLDPHAIRRARAKPSDVLADVTRLYIERHLMPRTRQWREQQRIFRAYVIPELGKCPMRSIRRSDVVQLMDRMSDNNGAMMADRTLSAMRRLFNWFALRDDLFVNPIIKGMSPINQAETARSRILIDDELRAFWLATMDQTPFNRLARFLLVTGQRKSEGGNLHTRELNGDLWTIPAERMKGNTKHTIPLNDMALALIGNRTGFAFSTTDGATAFNGFSKAKVALDKRMTHALGRDVEDWRLHDLRRTAITLMRREGVPREITEAVAAHKPQGVHSRYDRHDPIVDKRRALETLQTAVERICSTAAPHMHRNR